MKTTLWLTCLVTVALVAIVLGYSQTTGHRVVAWEKINGPYGCYVADIAVNPGNSASLYMATDVNGLYRSTNGGVTWSASNTGIDERALGGWTVAVNPANSQVIHYGAWDTGPGKSTDGGSTWGIQTLSNCICVLDYAISPSNANIVIVADQACVWKSTDMGDSWTRDDYFDTTSNHYAVAADPIDTNTLYAAGGDVYHCWFWKTTTGGGVWMNMSAGLDSTKFIWKIAPVPTEPNTIYIATDSGVYKTINGASTWNAANAGLAALHCRDIAVDPVQSNRLYVATWNGLFRSLDSAATWVEVSTSFTSKTAKTIDLDPSDPSIVYAGVTGGVYKSTDGGDTWAFYDSGLPQDVIVGQYGIAIDPGNSNVLYVGTQGGGIAKSTDGGTSFTYMNNGITVGYTQGLLLSPHDSQTLLYFSRGGDFVSKTTNGGLSWSPARTGLPEHYFYVMCSAFDPWDSTTAYLGTYADGAYRTTDGGASWVKMNLGNDSLIVRGITPDPTTPGLLYAATYAGLLRSTNYGDSWTLSSTGLNDLTLQSVAVSRSDPGRMYAGTRTSGLFVSLDSGATWDSCGPGLTGKTVRGLLVHPLNPLTVYVATYFDGVFMSTDGGDSWQASNDGITNTWTKDMQFDNPIAPSFIYVGTREGVFRSSSLLGTTVSLNTVTGWNLLSLNADVADGSVASVLPSRISQAFTFDNGYIHHDTLIPGIGYWVKFAGDETIPVFGQPLVVDTVPVKSGWNMVGSLAVSMPVGTISVLPETLALSNFFGYQGAYVNVDTLVPGHGYWVKSSQEGWLVLNANSGSSQPFRRSLHSTVEEVPKQPQRMRE